MEAIDKWFENQDYWLGVSLYEKYGDNNFLKNLFKSSKSNYNESKLYDELSLLQKQSEKIEPTLEEREIVKSDPNIFLIKKKEHQLKQIYRAIDNNRFQLLRATSDKTRKEYAFQILKLQQKKQTIYQEIDYLQEHGTLPTIKSKSENYTTPEIQRLYVQISKARKRLEKSPDKIRNRAKTENLLAEKMNKLNLLLDERRGL